MYSSDFIALEEVSTSLAAMSEARDYGLDGASPMRLNTSPTQPDLEAQSPMSPYTENKLKPQSPTESVRLRKPMRSNTAKTYRPERRGQEWHPGQEPGIDVSVTHPHPSSYQPELHEECQITVVDFSEEDIRLQHLDNETLGDCMDKGRPEWASCRWINVNGLSWDVIKRLGNHKNLHRLAIEDLLNTRNRTKADWYSDHTYMVLPLQKLIHFHSEEDCDSDCSEWDDAGRRGPQKKKKRSLLSRLRRRKAKEDRSEPPKPLDTSAEINKPTNGFVTAHATPDMKAPITNIRTLQRYHGGPNEERIEFMEKHSALASKGLGVSVEQVSIFLTSDNTVISFFESSAEDIESPIITRLSTQETILRRTSDASMITQVRGYPHLFKLYLTNYIITGNHRRHHRSSYSSRGSLPRCCRRTGTQCPHGGRYQSYDVFVRPNVRGRTIQEQHLTNCESRQHTARP